MALTQRLQRWTKQPPSPSQINWASPLLSGADRKRSVIWTPTSSLPATRTAVGQTIGRPGVASTFNGSSSYLTLANSGDVPAAVGVTVFILLRGTSAPSTAIYEQPISRVNGSGQTPLNLSWSHGSPPYSQAWASNDGGTWTPLGYSGLQGGVWYLLAASVKTGTNNFRIYKDGVFVAASTVTGLTTGMQGAMFVGAGTADGSTPISYFGGDVALVGEVGRAWSDAEHAQFAANPWQLFAPQRIWVPASAATGISGAASVTLANLTSSSTGTVLLKAASSVTLANLTAAATGTLAIQGTSSTMLVDVTVGATGALKVQGSSASTLADATVAAAGTLALKGASAVNLADVTTVATGTLALKGASATTLADLTTSATGVVHIAGASAATLADVTLVATGSLVAQGTGALAVTLANLTVAAAGQLKVAGVAAPALGDLMLAATGVLRVAGVSSVTLQDATLAATATLVSPGSGAVNITLGTLTLSSAAKLGIGGAAQILLDPVASSSTATLLNRGALAVTFADLIAHASAVVGDGSVPARDFSRDISHVSMRTDVVHVSYSQQVFALSSNPGIVVGH